MHDEPDLTPADLKRLRGFLSRPAPDEQPLPRLHESTAFQCHLEQRLREDGAMLARVAPWLLTARLVVR